MSPWVQSAVSDPDVVLGWKDVDGAAPRQSRDWIKAVLRVIYLLFNEGYWSGNDVTPIRVELCRLAVGLSYSVVEAYPAEPEAIALLDRAIDSGEPDEYQCEAAIALLDGAKRSKKCG